MMQNVIAGPHPASYVGMPFEPLPFVYPDLKGTRLALAFATGSPAISPDIRANLEAAAEALRSRGARVETVELNWDNAEIAAVLIEAIFGLFFNEYLEEFGPDQLSRATPYLRWLIAKSLLLAASMVYRPAKEAFDPVRVIVPGFQVKSGVISGNAPDSNFE